MPPEGLLTHKSCEILVMFDVLCQWFSVKLLHDNCVLKKTSLTFFRLNNIQLRLSSFVVAIVIAVMSFMQPLFPSDLLDWTEIAVPHYTKTNIILYMLLISTYFYKTFYKHFFTKFTHPRFF